jgi:ferredoxin
MPENINIQQVPDKYTNTSTFPIIDAALCIGCSACVNKCPSQAIILEDGKAKITTSNCKNCRLCISICPVGAIS